MLFCSFKQVSDFLKRKSLCCYFLFLSIGIGYSAKASHLVGGYLRMTQLDRVKGKFKFSISQYVDMIGIAPNRLMDLHNNYATLIYIYRKRDNTLVEDFVLGYNNALKETEVIYDNKSCADLRKLRTSVFEVDSTYTLNLSNYSDPEGYYIEWLDCCRNGALSNVVNPYVYGTILTLEFPALLQNGQPIVFSSPYVPIVNGDYICANKLFKYDFSAVDPNGDELRYSLAKPYATKDFIAKLQPIPTVEWAPGISDQAMIPGNPSLQINAKTGEISVKANRLGLFVFMIRVEKYRNGKKIGELMHEFQLPVVDCSNLTPSVPIITQNGSPVQQVEFCRGTTVTLETASNPDWGFQWQKDGDNIEGATMNQFTVSKPGTYAVIKSLLKTCANDTISGLVIVKEKPLSDSIKITASKLQFCPTDSVILKATSLTNTSFEWFYGTKLIGNTVTLVVKQAGNYSVIGKKDALSCPSVPDSIHLDFLQIPNLITPQQSNLCPGDTILLTTTKQSNWLYQWSFEKKNIGQTASIMVKDTGIYIVQVIDEKGCRNNSSFVVSLKDECKPVKLYIPDIFTPNQDGVNDRWEIRNVHLALDCQVTVFNRWGEVVFYSEGYPTPWDGLFQGSLVEKGTYAYVIYLPSQQYYYRGRVMVWY